MVKIKKNALVCDRWTDRQDKQTKDKQNFKNVHFQKLSVPVNISSVTFQ